MEKKFFNELSLIGREGINQYVYFQLASVGASIGFIATQTKNTSISVWAIPALLSVIFMGVSFWYGIHCLKTRANAYQLEANAFRWDFAWANEKDLEKKDEHKTKSQSYVKRQREEVSKCIYLARKQTQFLCAGVLMFFVWHIIEMWRRTPENMCLWV